MKIQDYSVHAQKASSWYVWDYVQLPQVFRVQFISLVSLFNNEKMESPILTGPPIG
jgi:hypothetical protein